MPYRDIHFQKGRFYHVFTRGMKKKKLFFQPGDNVRLLERMKFLCNRTKVRVHAYCLMPNHFHLLLEQVEDKSISKFMQRLLTSYGKYFSIKYETKGQIFEDRFKARRIIEKEYLLYVFKYIQRNPIEAGLVKKLSDYGWSSYGVYAGEQGNSLVTSKYLLGFFGKNMNEQIKKCIKYLEKDFDKKDLEAYRINPGVEVIG